MITDTKFDEDISTDIRGRGEEGQAPRAQEPAASSQVPWTIKAHTRLYVLSCSSDDLGVEFCSSCQCKARHEDAKVSRQAASRPIEPYKTTPKSSECSSESTKVAQSTHLTPLKYTIIF